MQREDLTAPQNDAQSAIAATGIKALIPIDRPFLDYVLNNLGDAGYKRICLVIGRKHDALFSYYSQVKCERLAIEFSVQAEPLGTANAVAAARDFVGQDDFLVVNSDNCYPAVVLRKLREIGEPATAGFEPGSLIQNQDGAGALISAYSVIVCGSDGYLRRIIEKPDVAELSRLSPPILVSMNCWRFSPEIFAACQQIKPSLRGEYEIPDAVMYSIREMGQQYRVIPCSEPVLDLSSRRDVAPVTELLKGKEVRL
jgi:glucose-1-phosphate thymidylyltransferase